MAKTKATLQRRARYAKKPVTTTRRYRVPTVALKAIRKLAPVYGSQGRVIQVATELLIRQKKPLKLPYKISIGLDSGKEKMVRTNYKLLPRTVELINRLTPIYGTQGKTLVACALVLK